MTLQPVDTLMPKGKIAFQGEKGANSHMACLNVFPDMHPLPCATFEDAFNSVSTGECQLAMIPIENSLAGRVADIHQLLPQSSLHIIGEYFMPIHFNLVVKNGVILDEIKTVHSHVHALGQCRNIIRAHNWQAQIAGDTAGAARWVAEQPDRSNAALCPALAAKLYGLDVLIENAEDADHNTTRFIVLSSNEVKSAPDKEVITTFVFKVRNIPAALYKAMGGFATNGVNMTKLESYQIGGQFTATQFYADIEGHPEQENVRLALEELAFFADVKILGIYPQADFRKKPPN